MRHAGLVVAAKAAKAVLCVQLREHADDTYGDYVMTFWLSSPTILMANTYPIMEKSVIPRVSKCGI